MTDFHKLFIIKINKMIKKKTGASFLVVCVVKISTLSEFRNDFDETK